MKKISSILFIFLITLTLNSQGIGCLSSIEFKNSAKECSNDDMVELEDSTKVISLDRLIEEKKKGSLKNQNIKDVNITKKIASVEIKFKGKLFTIQEEI